MYTKYKRGSEWRIWDLHIHTPGTKKNDLFEGSNIGEKWDKYIDTINNSDEDIAVVGITDYFSIDNYFKFKELVSSGRITKRFELILPNIELRIHPVTSSSTPINIHCLFNPSIEDEIEDRFLSKLSFGHGQTTYDARRSSLIRLGRERKQNQSLDEEAALKFGVEEFVISFETLRTVFEKDPKLRNDTVIAVSNKSTDGVTGVVKHEDFFSNSGSQLDATRESIYQLSNAIFSSNENDRLYFLGKRSDDKKTVIKKTGSLKSCYHGSDAHQNDKLFKPDDNRYCWIKADPTFEGLKQTLYEPDDRVQIQSFKPDFKNDRYIISELNFKDSTDKLFGNQKLLLNENLNSIIGGKSSGKSLLLYSTAKTIDPEQVEKTAKRLGFEGYKFDTTYNFEVVWKNGTKDSLISDSEKNQKIIYIPQLYINYLVERDNKEDLNKLVENILLQDPEFKSFFEKTDSEIKEINNDINNLLRSYLQTRKKAIELQQKSKEIGKSSDITKAIKRIQESIKQGQKLSNLTEEEFKTYNELLEKKSNSEEELLAVKKNKEVLQSVLSEVIENKNHLLGSIASDENLNIKGSVDRILDQIADLPSEILDIRKKIDVDYDSLITNLKAGIDKLNLDEEIRRLNESITKIKDDLKPYLIKLEGQKELRKLTNNLELEKKKLAEAISLEKQFQKVLDDYNNQRNRTAYLLKKRILKYESIANTINKTKSDIGSEIILTCSLIYKQEGFQLFHQTNKAAISREHFFHNLFEDDNLKYNQIPDIYSKHLYVKDERYLKAVGDNEFDIPLRQGYTLDEILTGLVEDNFKLDYSVTYRGDELLNMSPGKKGTVLLILFLQISSSKYPILIDQPEDNLDNRTIYDLLCHMIKEKKKERQIIIVSHNANLVVATDSENIIIANQEGQELIGSTSQYRFEYVNGSLEHTFSKDTSIQNILLQQGIREHVCDVLEGGNEAFKQRERKYSIKL